MTIQERGHPEGHDYRAGSPHLKHDRLHHWMAGTLSSLVAGCARGDGPPDILEVGAGHGSFTDHLLKAGARVTITEMSGPSAHYLQSKYQPNVAVTVVHDEHGDQRGLPPDRMFDAVVCVSVLHHIPDYLAAIRSLTDRVRPGGVFVSFQDPLWYPRLQRWSVRRDRAAHYLWRLGQGDLRAGLASFVRRRRGAMDETNPRDMVEYHVLRDGCDELAIADVLGERFASVRIERYWSTPSSLLQSIGERLGWVSSFGVIASGRR